MKICKGSEIGERCRISIANSLEIGDKVLLSPNVYITDCDHEYRNINIPVIDRGIVQRGREFLLATVHILELTLLLSGMSKLVSTV